MDSTHGTLSTTTRAEAAEIKAEAKELLVSPYMVSLEMVFRTLRERWLSASDQRIRNLIRAASQELLHATSDQSS